MRNEKLRCRLRRRIYIFHDSFIILILWGIFHSLFLIFCPSVNFDRARLVRLRSLCLIFCPSVRFHWARLVRLCSLFLIFCPSVRFHWARGASARGEPKEDRGKLASSHSPFPLWVLPSRSPFLIPFPPCCSAQTFMMICSFVPSQNICRLACPVYWVYSVYSVYSAPLPRMYFSLFVIHFSLFTHPLKSGKQRTPNEWLTPLGERGSRKGERERETLRREGNASLRVSPLSLGCLSRIRAPRPMKSNTRTKDKAHRAQYLINHKSTAKKSRQIHAFTRNSAALSIFLIKIRILWQEYK